MNHDEVSKTPLIVFRSFIEHADRMLNFISRPSPIPCAGFSIAIALPDKTFFLLLCRGPLWHAYFSLLSILLCCLLSFIPYSFPIYLYLTHFSKPSLILLFFHFFLLSNFLGCDLRMGSFPIFQPDPVQFSAFTVHLSYYCCAR